MQVLADFVEHKEHGVLNGKILKKTDEGIIFKTNWGEKLDIKHGDYEILEEDNANPIEMLVEKVRQEEPEDPITEESPSFLTYIKSNSLIVDFVKSFF